MDTATVTARGATRIRSGHPWVYRQDVTRGPATDASSGGPQLVRVLDGHGKLLGTATWAAAARLALRMVSVGDDGPSELQAMVRTRLESALARRRAMNLDRDAFRVAHAESDALPGLVVDRYADAAVIQTTSVAMDAARDGIARIVADLLGARVVVERDDGSSRDFEGLPRRSGILLGGGPTTITYRLGPNDLEADLLADGKTGGFLDQADNHAQVAALAAPGARCLDAFTYHGGFALALARRGGTVLATDENPEAVARTAANATRNGLTNLETRVANAFDLVRTLESQGQQFDAVVLDPPALVKRATTSAERHGHGARDAGLLAAERGYRELVLRGARLTRAGGVLAVCSCSGRMTRDHWEEIVVRGVADAGRQAQVLARLGAGRDHPELLGVPETGHLKCWIMRMM